MTQKSLMAGAVFVTQIAVMQTALASQGPGVPPGTASAFLQMTMAVLVYGAGTIALIAAAIGARRKS